jgi:hypothetical protein
VIDAMRLKDLLGLVDQVLLPNSLSADARATLMTFRDPFNDRLPGQGRANGRAQSTFGCSGSRGATQSLGRNRARFDADSGASITTRRVNANRGCFAYFTQTTFSGNQIQPVGSTITSMLSIQLLPPNADPECWDSDKLCLQQGRFKADLEWADANGLQGRGMGFPQTDNSGVFWFLDPRHAQSLIKLVNGCDANGHYWLQFESSTNVSWELTITDTQTDQVRTYSKPVDQREPPILDTQAFATCP